MTYYKGNSELFKPFNSNEIKIRPKLTDDWEILSGGYENGSSLILHSKKLNQKVYNIKLIRFLELCKLEDIAVKGLKIQGKFIIGNDRSLYTEKMFNKWKNKNKKNKVGIFIEILNKLI